jgi:hypothetical protein
LLDIPGFAGVFSQADSYADLDVATLPRDQYHIFVFSEEA